MVCSIPYSYGDTSKYDDGKVELSLAFFVCAVVDPGERAQPCEMETTGRISYAWSSEKPAGLLLALGWGILRPSHRAAVHNKRGQHGKSN